MDRYTAGRKPFQIIEIEQDFCLNSYGDSVCQAQLPAQGSKCYNTLPTCQMPQNYAIGSRTLRFCTDSQDIPTDNYYMPFLKSVSIKPAEINPGGGNRGQSPLGKRATISASFRDAPHSGRYIDLYHEERITGAAQGDGIGYLPETRSTFWRKWAARNRYYLNRPMRYISGYIENGQIVDEVVRHYVITGFSGPDKNGSVTIEGKDILALAQREKAQAPRASEGKLDSVLPFGGDEVDMTPIGVGVTYPASGVCIINDEIMRFTRSGDTLTITERAAYGTEMVDHEAGATVQVCWEVVSKTPREILYQLLHDFSGIDDQFLDLAQWAQEETDFLPTLYSTIICKPTEVEELLNEIMEQMYFYVWFDERTNKVGMRAVRAAATEDVTILNETSNLLADTVSVKDQADQVITRVVVNYGIRDYTKGLEEPSNYAVTDVIADLDEESYERLRMAKTKTINSRWLTGMAGAQALQLGQYLLKRYKVPPKLFTFSLDAKDRDLWLADYCVIETHGAVDADGNLIGSPAQVMSAQESMAGTTLTYTAQQFQFEEPPPFGDRPLMLSSDALNINLRDYYDSIYGTPPTDDDTVVLTIRSGVVVGSVDTSEPALEILDSDWPSGTSIVINIQPSAFIVGRGGNGAGIDSLLSTWVQATDGGVGLKADRPIVVKNDGTIGGGGGGGGLAMASGIIPNSPVPLSLFRYGTGGGGAGGGQYGKGVASPSSRIKINVGTNGGPTTNGAGGVATSSSPSVAARGGAGGGLGLPGAAATASTSTGSIIIVPPSNAGPAIDGDSFITWESEGDIRGDRIN